MLPAHGTRAEESDGVGTEITRTVNGKQFTSFGAIALTLHSCSSAEAGPGSPAQLCPEQGSMLETLLLPCGGILGMHHLPIGISCARTQHRAPRTRPLPSMPAGRT